MKIEGVTGAPYNMPRTQRAIPAPFRRPSINAGGVMVKRTWQQTKVMDVKEGDVIAEFGRVDLIEEWLVRDPFEYRVQFTNPDGLQKTCGAEATVLAFSSEQTTNE